MTHTYTQNLGCRRHQHLVVVISILSCKLPSSSSANNNYSLHEQSEKRFNKWLAEMEQSLDFIEKGLAAESALININQDGSITNFNTDDTALYSNVSEMQQMHMNYYEKIKVMVIFFAIDQ